MCITKMDSAKCKQFHSKRMNLLGDVIREVLATAKSQKRLVCGLLDAIMFLQKKAEEALICFIPLTQPGDAASHMHIVLLQAFCFENDIPVVEVDNSEKLAELCGIRSNNNNNRRKAPVECKCVIVSRDVSVPFVLEEEPILTSGEETLRNFYDCTIEKFPRPVIQLPG